MVVAVWDVLLLVLPFVPRGWMQEALPSMVAFFYTCILPGDIY